MSEQLQEKLDEALVELKQEPEKEEEPKSKVVKDTYDAAVRRLQSGVVAQLAIIAAFIVIGFGNMALTYLREGKIITPEGMIFLLLGVTLYGVFHLVTLAYNHFSLKLQNKAVEIDIEENKAHRARMENENYMLQKEHERTNHRMILMKQENRVDQKLTQDLELRRPFFEEAQKGMMKFFARDDIVQALQVPPTFTEAVERLDDVLLKRTEMNVTAEKINNKLNNVMISYADMCQQSKINEELLNQTHLQNAEIMAKWRETDIGLKQLQLQVGSMMTSFDTLMEIMTSQVPEGEPAKTVEVKIKAVPEPSIANDVDALLEEEQKRKESLPPPPT